MVISKEKVVIVSGYFNPLHTGHISYFEEAKKLGDYLIVIVNNDEQVKVKGSKEFMNEQDRLRIVKALKVVDDAVLSGDKDGSVCQSLEILGSIYKDKYSLIFAKGGDRTIDNIPEREICEKMKIKMKFDVGCKKTISSSELLNKVK